MAGSKTDRKAAQVNSEKEVDVLYQKLGDQWFAFSIVEDEVFMSPVSQDQINEIKLESAVTRSFESNDEAVEFKNEAA